MVSVAVASRPPCPRRARARVAAETGDPDIVRAVAKAGKRPITAYDHIRALDAALVKFDGVGLERFVPHHVLEEGQDPVLAPHSMLDRPMLSFRADQLASGFMGLNF